MSITRRSSLKLAAAALALPNLGSAESAAGPGKTAGGDAPSATPVARKGRIKQSVVPWCFRPLSVPELAKHAAALGLKSVELCDPKFWPELKNLGLTCAIAGSHGFSRGFAHLEEHEACLAILRERIQQCADAGIQRVITFSGFRRGLSDQEGTANMVAGLKKIASFAEEKKVSLCLEMLNSRVDIEMKGHPDYFCDNIDRTVEICQQVGSDRIKVLFDLYHVQIMHGDVISRLRQYMPYIGHIHTAGVPGRNEIDDTQEMNYPGLMRALHEMGYAGYVGQEFIPTRDPIASLAEGVAICDV
jgi:hydroxypyruvate isomerase